MEPGARPQHEPGDEGAPGDSPEEGSPGLPLEPPGLPSWRRWAPQHPGEGFEPEPQASRPLPQAHDAADPPPPGRARPFMASPPPSSAPAAGAVEIPSTLTGPSHSRKLTREIVETVLLAILVFLAIRASFQNFRVQGDSMYPGLENGQFVIVSPLLYKRVDTGRLDDFIPLLNLREGQRDVFMSPSRGDIIIFHGPQGSDLVKRVIGLPGETVQVTDGVVYINERRLDEPYISEPWSSTMPRTFIPPDYYFVLGDNRNNSEDSRSPRVGLVAREQIIGKALVSWWPYDRIGLPPQAPGQLSSDSPPASAPAAPGSR